MDSSKPKCPICYETIQNKNFIVTNCNHTFCSNCILRLNRTSNSCPLCRADLTTFPIPENNNVIQDNAVYSNEFYRNILEESESAINSFETTVEGYRFIVQNLLSIIQIGNDEQITNNVVDDNNEYVFANDNDDLENYNNEVLDDYDSEVLDDYDSQENSYESNDLNSCVTDTEFESLYNKFEENRFNALINLATNPVWDYIDPDQRTIIYNQVVDDWNEAKIFCLFPDIYTINRRLENKLNELSINVLKIIINHYDGDCVECHEKNEYVEKLLEIIPNYIPSLVV